ncbi:MAG: tRNA (adenosine(37)-N6)-threonylcarbamoyltransferase complex dimerization subunit type 1 TsaB [Candidatus Omnitrophica bacterium]|nr:tRNA (adenosine(37)-N6)-threonylcarbamoyltransferase complex dimerization subunit type 1 TsaB [Candidatus Omnitrophota bacterium]
MHLLSIESSTKIFALAVSRDGQILRYRNLKTHKVLEDSMIPAIDRILSSAGVPFKKLDAFAIGLGPGSFTSLRVGLSTVKAFAMATHKPVVGVCSLDVIAQGAGSIGCDEICVITDARRDLLYSAFYQKAADGLKLKGDYQLADLKTILEQARGRTLFVGDGAGMCRQAIERGYEEHARSNPTDCVCLFAPEKFWFPRGRHLAKLGFERLSKGQSDDAAKLVPMYLYPRDCQVGR